jgi:hypothetical protein
VVILVAKIANEAMVPLMARSGGGLALGHCKDAFTFDLGCFIKTFCKFCTFSAICKDNAAIICITVQHKKNRSRQY